MKLRFLFRDFEIGDGTKQQLLYGVAVLICIVSVFGIVLFMAYFSEDPSKGGFPSPTPGVFSNLAAQAQQQQQQGQVAGAQTQQQQIQQQQPPSPEGPAMPSPLPSPSPSPSPLPSPSAIPSPSPSPSPTPTPQPNNPTPSPSPSPSASPSPIPTQTPIPSPPTNLLGKTSCPDNSPKMELTWDSVLYATSYKLYKNGLIISSSSTATNYTDNNFSNQQPPYLYFVRAVNSTGESADSEPFNQTTNPCP